MIPLWLKIFYTLMVCIIVPVYWRDHGPSNFLWFSDIALLSLVPALWFEVPLIASMMAVGVLPFELIWLIDFVAGGNFVGIAAYMFSSENLPLYLRALSLFHIVLPPVLIFMLIRFGYDRRAIWAQTLLAFTILPISYFFTDPAENINWVFGPGEIQNFMSPLYYLGLWMLALPIFVYVPVHMILKKFFPLRAQNNHPV